MANICISSCIDDVRRPTFVNRYKWPESEAEFVRSASSNSNQGQPRIVDGISSRQMYLRSYTFSRKQSLPEMTMKFLGMVKKSATITYRRESKNMLIVIKALTDMIRTKAEQASYAAFLSHLHRFGRESKNFIITIIKTLNHTITSKAEQDAAFLSLFQRFGRETKNFIIAAIKALTDMITTKACPILSKAEQLSDAAILSLFHRFRSCTVHKS